MPTGEEIARAAAVAAAAAPTFFLDNNISPKYAKLLEALDVQAVALKDRFDVGAEDVEWMPEVGRLGWIVVTADERIRSRPAERAAMAAAGLTVIFLPDGFTRKPKWSQAAWFVKTWPVIDRAASQMRPGSQVRIKERGGIEWLPAVHLGR